MLIWSDEWRLCSRVACGGPPLKRRPFINEAVWLPGAPSGPGAVEGSRLARNLPSFRRKKRRQPQARQIPSLKSLRSSLLQNRPKKLRHPSAEKARKDTEPEFEVGAGFSNSWLIPNSLVPAYDQKPPRTRIAPSATGTRHRRRALAPPAAVFSRPINSSPTSRNEIDGLELTNLSPAFRIDARHPVSSSTPREIPLRVLR